MESKTLLTGLPQLRDGCCACGSSPKFSGPGEAALVNVGGGMMGMAQGAKALGMKMSMAVPQILSNPFGMFLRSEPGKSGSSTDLQHIPAYPWPDTGYKSPLACPRR